MAESGMDLLEIPKLLLKKHAKKIRKVDPEPGMSGETGEVPKLGWLTCERWEKSKTQPQEEADLYFHSESDASFRAMLVLTYQRQDDGNVNISCNVQSDFARSVGGVLRQMRLCVQLLEEAQKLADGERP